MMRTNGLLLASLVGELGIQLNDAAQGACQIVSVINRMKLGTETVAELRKSLMDLRGDVERLEQAIEMLRASVETAGKNGHQTAASAMDGMRLKPCSMKS